MIEIMDEYIKEIPQIKETCVEIKNRILNGIYQTHYTDMKLQNLYNKIYNKIPSCETEIFSLDIDADINILDNNENFCKYPVIGSRISPKIYKHLKETPTISITYLHISAYIMNNIFLEDISHDFYSKKIFNNIFFIPYLNMEHIKKISSDYDIYTLIRLKREDSFYKNLFEKEYISDSIIIKETHKRIETMKLLRWFDLYTKLDKCLLLFPEEFVSGIVYGGNIIIPNVEFFIHFKNKNIYKKYFLAYLNSVRPHELDMLANQLLYQDALLKEIGCFSQPFD